MGKDLIDGRGRKEIVENIPPRTPVDDLTALRRLADLLKIKGEASYTLSLVNALNAMGEPFWPLHLIRAWERGERDTEETRAMLGEAEKRYEQLRGELPSANELRDQTKEHPLFFEGEFEIKKSLP